MGIISSIIKDELLEKWFKYMYKFERNLNCTDIPIMVSDLRNCGLNDDMVMALMKSSYPRKPFLR